MARGPLCSSPESTHTLDHRADPLGAGARCAAMRSINGYTRVSARRCFFPHLGEPIMKVYFSVWPRFFQCETRDAWFVCACALFTNCMPICNASYSHAETSVCVYTYCYTTMQGTFYQFDADRSGTVEPHELNRALVAFGYNLSAPAQGAILRHFSTDGKISFDSFVACLIKLRILTSECCAILRTNTALHRTTLYTGHLLTFPARILFNPEIRVLSHWCPCFFLLNSSVPE